MDIKQLSMDLLFRIFVILTCWMQSTCTFDPGPTERGSLNDFGRARKIIVTTMLEPPYMMLKKEGMFLTGNDRFHGYLVDILEKLSLSVGFTFDIRLIHDGRKGGKGENDTWIGMIGELYRGEADIALATLTVNEEDKKVIEFTEPFITHKYSAIITKPKRMHKRNEERTKTYKRIRTAQDLLAANMNFGVISGSVPWEIFKTSTDPLLMAMYSRMNTFWPPVFAQSVQEGVQRARMEEYAFILDTPMAEFIASRRPCDFYTTEPMLEARDFAFGIRKEDMLRLAIDDQLRNMKQSGELDLIYNKWWTSECHRKRASGKPKEVAPGVTEEVSPWRYATASPVRSKGYTILNFSWWKLLLLSLYVCCFLHYILFITVL